MLGRALVLEASYAAHDVADVAGQLREVCARLPRRFDRVSELALLSAAHVLGDAWPAHCGLFFSTAEGNLSGTMAYLERLRDKGGHFANPIEFPNLLMSAPAGNVSLHLGIKGTVLTFHQGEVSGFHALVAACDALEAQRVDHALVVEAEETSEWHTRVHGRPTSESTAGLRLAWRQARPGDVVVRDLQLSGANLPHLSGERGSLAACAATANALKQGERTWVLSESEVHGSGAVLLERL